MAETTCSVENCDKPVRGHGVCRNHLYRLQKYGDPLGGMPPKPTACKIPGCGKPRKANGWCAMHYQRWLRHGDPMKTLYLQPPKACSVDGCGDIAMARGWCSKHWQRWQQWGDPLRCARAKADMIPNLGRTCSVEGCDKAARAKGWCGTHHSRWLRRGSTDLPQRQTRTVPPCSIEDCADPSDAQGLCNKHYMRLRIHGDPQVCLVSEIVDFCSEPDCRHRAMKVGVCWKHYREIRLRLEKEQNYRCAICGIHENDAPGKKLRFDHDHVTRRPRALLCHHCNVGLGHFKDNPDLLRAAVRYLEETKSGQLTLFAA
jgi:hypothetical protein